MITYAYTLIESHFYKFFVRPVLVIFLIYYLAR